VDLFCFSNKKRVKKEDMSKFLFSSSKNLVRVCTYIILTPAVDNLGISPVGSTIWFEKHWPRQTDLKFRQWLNFDSATIVFTVTLAYS
jgi:hypothetical protein